MKVIGLVLGLVFSPVKLTGLGRRREDDATKFSASDWNHSRQAAIGSWINRRVSAVVSRRMPLILLLNEAKKSSAENEAKKSSALLGRR